jgi:heat shock protein HtpX
LWGRLYAVTLTGMGRARSRTELFPADRGLVVRMVLVSVLTPLTVVALLALCVLIFPLKLTLGLAAVSFFAWRALRSDRRAAEHLLADGEEPELQAVVARLCVAADLPRPEIVVHDERQANSWIVDPLRRRPRLHVTRGLLDLLEPLELEAVVAHELCHVAHRDAAVMTVVGMPVAVLQRGATAPGWWWPVGGAKIAGGVIGFVAGFGSTALSRYRELTADAGAAQLTGRPAALASALMKISGGLALVPDEDLRLVAGRDALHIVAVEDRSHWLWRLHGRSHPSVEQRVAALERLEHRLAHARCDLAE